VILSNVQLCLSADVVRFGVWGDAEMFPVIDFGFRTENTIVPMNLTDSIKYVEVSDWFCGIIEEMNSGDTVVLITRVKDYESYRKTSLRVSANVIVSICAFLYALLTVMSAYFAYRFQESALLLVLAWMTVHGVWRTVHLIVVAASWGTVESSVLSEPPTFLRSSCVAELVILFETSLILDKTQIPRLRMLYRLMINIPLYLFMIAIIVLSYELPEGDLRYFSCFGFLDEGANPWPNSKILNVSYISTLSLLTLLKAIQLLRSAAKIESKLGGSSGKRGGEKKKARVTTYFKLAMFYGISFLVEMGLLLGFSIPGVTIVELRVILLLITEKAGLVYTMYALYSREEKMGKTGQTTTATSASKATTTDSTTN